MRKIFYFFMENFRVFMLRAYDIITHAITLFAVELPCCSLVPIVFITGSYVYFVAYSSTHWDQWKLLI